MTVDYIAELEATVATLQQELNRVDGKEDLLRGQIAELSRAIDPVGKIGTVPLLAALADAHRQDSELMDQRAAVRAGGVPHPEIVKKA